MLQRCRPGGHPDYGGRGIRVCDRWKSYEVFLQDVGRRPSPKHSLDRIDNEGNYEPGNVRWATIKEQNRNTRGNRSLTPAGRTQVLIEWAEETGIPAERIRGRLRCGWTVGQALGFEPRQKLSESLQVLVENEPELAAMLGL